MNDSHKISADHLQRDAYVYVRQLTLHQVVNNTESSRRQYDLRGRAVALGWPAERVIVIDSDQGESGASATDREGFQRLVADVSLKKAGIVLGLECSRLARNNADWHRLLELCALSGTLICDEDGLYEPAAINDRLLLGLKGTISEAELHLIRARLQGGILAKAARGELRLRLPVGLLYDACGSVVLDPDTGVRDAFEHLFESFQATGSAHAVVKQFAAERLRFPSRYQSGPHAGELHFRPLHHNHVLSVLHSPRYAGAYCYGRRQQITSIDGRSRQVLKPRDQWTVLIPDAHPGYITLERYERNQATLAANAAACGAERRAGPPREGPALLQGIVLCGSCGKRMEVGYHKRANGQLLPDYKCRQPEPDATANPQCQAICGEEIDKAVTALVLKELSPLALEAALTVTNELAQRAADADRIRATTVQRAQHAVEQARRRYLAVDPTNRLVADTLEADWNNRLRELSNAEEEYNRAGEADNATLTDAQQTRIRALVSDLPALFNDPATPIRERKRLIRLLVTDVTLVRAGEQIAVHVRLSGGTLHTLTVPRPLQAWEAHTTPASTIELIDELLAEHTPDEAVKALAERGITGGWGRPFTVASLTQVCRKHDIPDLRQRLLSQGMLTLEEIAAQLGADTQTIRRWRARGLITGRRINNRFTHLYHPGQSRPDRDRHHHKAVRAKTIPRSRHHPHHPTPETTTTTNPPGGAV